jgi:signal transduction histidine kinase/CheY-like chemotaxis protein
MKTQMKYSVSKLALPLFIIALVGVIVLKVVENKSIDKLIDRNNNSLTELESQSRLLKLHAEINAIETAMTESVKTDDSSKDADLKKRVVNVQADLEAFKSFRDETAKANPAYDELAQLYEEKADVLQDAANAYYRNKEESDKIINSSRNKEIFDSTKSFATTLLFAHTITASDIASDTRTDGDAVDNKSFAFSAVAFIVIVLLCWYMYNKKRQTEFSERKVKAAASVKENFLANMSHEIRTPLNAILGFTNILQKSRLDPQQQKHIQIIQSSGNSLLSIVNDILDLSKIEAGMMRIEESPFRVTDVMGTVEQMLMPKAEEKNLQLIIKVDEDIPETLCGDAVRLTQVLVNLISNAIKFTEEGGVYVKVTPYKKTNDSICLEFLVRDTGIGIPKDKQKFVFERFEQAEAETTRRFGGTGLGLSIVKHLVDLQKGNLTLSSEEEYGTTFLVELTYKFTNEAAPAMKQNKSNNNLHLMKNNSCKILVAEDNAMNQQLIQHLLKTWGFEFDLVYNGLQAVEALKKQNYDIVLMDIQMPEMDGHTATKIIRNELKSTVPVIAMTAHAMAGEREKCINSGMNDYISKPLHEETLYEFILKYSKSINNKDNESNDQRSTPSTQGKLIDLQYIDSFSGGNPELKTQMIREFVKRVPDNIHMLEKAIEEKNYTTIYRISHDMKTTVHFLGLTTLIGHLLQRMEEQASTNGTIAIIRQMFEEVKSVCKRAVDEAVYLVA